MNKKIRKGCRIFFLLLSLVFLISCSIPVLAEEQEEENQEEETEYIPEEYYDPIQSNDLPGWPQGQAVQAAAAVVMDLDTNTLLYSKSAYDKMYPASITKIMTAMIALEIGDMDDEVTFSEIVYDLEEGSSHQGIQPGEKLTMRQCLYGLMLESANDIANGIAEHLAGSLSGFADLMNAKAQELGCVNTHFTNPHGLHNDEHYTCAYDMALIAQAAYRMPEFREIVSTTMSYCPPTNVTEEERYFVNHHKMIQEESDYYCGWCTGGKTGFTSDAWNTLVTYGEKNGLRLVCVLLHENGAGTAYLETADIMNYGFEQFEEVNVTSGSEDVTYYEAMKLNYLGKSEKMFQSDLLKQQIAKSSSGVVTIPHNVSVSDLNRKSQSLNQTTEQITYLYHNWPVGSARVEVYPLSTGIVLPFQKKLDMEALRPSSLQKGRNEVEATALMVMQRTKDFVGDAYTGMQQFAEKNTLTVILAGSLVLLILVIIIIILVVRCTRESRIQRRRRQEEKERLRKAEEIDQMTTAQIEQELRAAMEQERRKQELEAARREEQRREEEKLRETERILEEINKKS